MQNKAEKVSKLLSSFIPKTFGTPYNWKFFDTQNRKSLKEIILNSLSKSIKIGSLIGLTSSFLIAPIGAVMGYGLLPILSIILGITTLTSTSTSIKEIAKNIKDPKGKEIDFSTVIKNILENKPVYFQEQKATTITMPLLGEYTYYNDNRKEVKINNLQDLELYSKMQ